MSGSTPLAFDTPDLHAHLSTEGDAELGRPGFAVIVFDASRTWPRVRKVEVAPRLLAQPTNETPYVPVQRHL